MGILIWGILICRLPLEPGQRSFESRISSDSFSLTDQAISVWWIKSFQPLFPIKCGEVPELLLPLIPVEIAVTLHVLFRLLYYLTCYYSESSYATLIKESDNAL